MGHQGLTARTRERLTGRFGDAGGGCRTRLGVLGVEAQVGCDVVTEEPGRVRWRNACSWSAVASEPIIKRVSVEPVPQSEASDGPRKSTRIGEGPSPLIEVSGSSTS